MVPYILCDHTINRCSFDHILLLINMRSVIFLILWNLFFILRKHHKNIETFSTTNAYLYDTASGTDEQRWWWSKSEGVYIQFSIALDLSVIGAG